MPTRIIRDSARRSDTLAQLTGDQERFFWRLVLVADDFGRFDGRPAILRAEAFPAMLEAITVADVGRWLGELERFGFVQQYQHEGKPYGAFVAWEKHQQRRAKHSKFPAPAGICEHMRASASTCEHVPADSFEKREARSEKRGSEKRGRRQGVGQRAPLQATRQENGNGGSVEHPGISELPPSPLAPPTVLAFPKGGRRVAVPDGDDLLDDKLGTWCRTRGIDPDVEAEAFVLWVRHTGRDDDDTLANWRSRFRKWVGKGKNRGHAEPLVPGDPPRPPGAPPPGPGEAGGVPLHRMGLEGDALLLQRLHERGDHSACDHPKAAHS